MKAAALILLFAPVLAGQTGSLAGTVVDQASSQPLSGVHVRLYIGAMPEMAEKAYGAITDAGGRYSIASLPPGTYTVELERAGFQEGADAGFMGHQEVVVHPGEQITGRQLAMLPLILAAGRVVNEAGDAVPIVPVRASDGSTSVRYYGRHSQTSTDERGQFRLFLTPGKYYVMVEPSKSIGPSGPAEIRTDGSSDLPYATTYYPSAADLAGATQVGVNEGAPVTGLEIRVRTGAPRRNITVSGVVTGAPAGARVDLSYSWSEGPGQPQRGSGTKTVADGRFEFENIQPGHLRLLAQCSSGDVELQSDVVELDLQPPGVNDVRLALTPGGAITGTLEILGGDIAALAGQLKVELSPGESFGGIPPPATVDKAGAFRIAKVSPGKFNVRVNGLPEDAYVKAISLDGTSTDGTLDLTRGVRGPQLKITASLDGARISGELHGADGGPLLSARPWVFLRPEPGQIGPIVYPRTTGNRYEIKGVPPGKYRLYAADLGRVNPENAAAYLAHADTIEVVEGGRVVHDLNVQEAPNANPKQ